MVRFTKNTTPPVYIIAGLVVAVATSWMLLWIPNLQESFSNQKGKPTLWDGIFAHSSLPTLDLDLQGSLTGSLQPYFDVMDGVRAVTKSTEIMKSSSYSNTETNTTAFGYGDYFTMQPMTQEAQFPIGSNSKLFTAVAIYQLHEQGKLDVDADLSTLLDVTDFAQMGLPRSYRKFCPKLNRLGKCQHMTLRHLMGMSSGIYPTLNCDTPKNPSSCNPLPFFLNQGSIAKTVGTFLMEPLIFVPGTEYHYSNPNFVLAAYFVEKFSGLTFRDYLQRNILDVLKMKSTSFDFFNGALAMNPQRPRQFFKYVVPKEERNDVDSDADLEGKDAKLQQQEEYELLSVGVNRIQLDLGAASGTGGIVSTLADERKLWYALFMDRDHKFDGKVASGLFQYPATLKNFRTPISFFQEGKIQWYDQVYPVWLYYTQGVAIMCLSKDCKDMDSKIDNSKSDEYSPRWIMYEGGTETVLTANCLDVFHGAMTQIWTSTLVVTPPSQQVFEVVVQRQIGFSLDIIDEWSDNKFSSNTNMAMIMLLMEYPPGDDTSPAKI